MIGNITNKNRELFLVAGGSRLGAGLSAQE